MAESKENYSHYSLPYNSCGITLENNVCYLH